MTDGPIQMDQFPSVTERKPTALSQMSLKTLRPIASFRRMKTAWDNSLTVPMLMILLVFLLLALTISTLSEGKKNWRSGGGEKRRMEEGEREEKQGEMEEKQGEKNGEREEKQGEKKEEEEEKEGEKEEKQGEKKEEEEEKQGEKEEQQGKREKKRIERGVGRRRLRRQSLPTDNVLVYASNSNVSVTDRVKVLSKESQIRILERNLNTTVWSNASLLQQNVQFRGQISANGDQIWLSASQAVALVMKLGGGAQMEGTGDTLQVQLNESNGSANLPAHPGAIVHSRMEAQLTGQRVNLSWADLASRAIAFRASGARAVAAVATDWTRENAQEEVRVLSTPAEKSEQRELSVVANSAEYQVQIRLIGAESALLFYNSHIQIPSDHRSLLLNVLDWRVTVRSALSPFELHATENRLQVNCYEEALSLILLPDALQVHVGQSSSLTIVRSPLLHGKMSVNGAILSSSTEANSSLLTDRMEMTSRELRLSLSRNESFSTDPTANIADQSLLIDAVHSNLRLFHSNHTIASLTAEKHFVEILGGKPLLQISTGNISVEMELGKERKTVADLSTDILPKELMRTENVGDSFGIGPFVSRSYVSSTPPHSVVLDNTSSSSPVSITSSPFPSTSGLTVNLAPLSVPVTPQMADPSELFTFRHTFPPPFASARPLTSEAELLVQLNDSMAAFPSPDSELFTFSPSLAPDTDFLVGQFETVLTSKSDQRTTQSLFPLSATISALQLPEEAEEQQQRIAEQFPGIRRENLLIWRPEQIAETEESDGGGKLETYLVDEREGDQEKRPRRTLDTDGRMAEEQLLMRAVMEMDIAVEGEEDLRAERLRRELGEGIQRMLKEGDVLDGERKKKKRVRATERDEMQRRRAIREGEKGTEDEKQVEKAIREGEKGTEDEKQVEKAIREGEKGTEDEKKGTEKALSVSDVQLEYMGRMDTSNRKEMVRMHFTLEGGRKELEKGIGRIGEMDSQRVRETLLHEILSKPRLSAPDGSTPAGVSSPPYPSASPSSTLSALSARSLPVLLIGSLCLSAALFSMLTVLRPSARALSRVKRWMKRKNGSEWKVKGMGEKWADKRRREREGNGGGILPM